MTTPQHPTQVAQHLGYPSTLFGLTPEQADYWREPGLPWLTAELSRHPPRGHNGQALTWHLRELCHNRMAPRFPAGCAVNLAPVYARENLVVGKVYVCAFRDARTGQLAGSMGRLTRIGRNFLEARADNDPVPMLWRLREAEREAVWDVYEVTHYATYPELTL